MEPAPTEQTPSTIILTLPEILAAYYGGDDGLYHNRVWLHAHTLAAGHCHVIRETLAREIMTIDSAEILTHIEVYDTRAYVADAMIGPRAYPDSYNPSKVSQNIFTLWRRQEWAESNEKLRLSRLQSTKRQLAKSTRDICEWIARDFTIQMCGKQAPQVKALTDSFFLQAREFNYDITRFLSYLNTFVESFCMGDLKPRMAAAVASYENFKQVTPTI